MHATALILTLLASPATATGSVSSADLASDAKERIEVLWLDAEGTSGRLTTTPMFLDGKPGEYHFGARFCGRSHRLGEHTLRALQGALASGQPVRVDAETFRGAGGTTRQCVSGVAFFAPVR